jgi:hypothetical protein
MVGFSRAQNHVGRAYPDMQGPGKARFANDRHLFPFTKPQCGQSATKGLLGVQSRYDGRLAWAYRGQFELFHIDCLRRFLGMRIILIITDNLRLRHSFFQIRCIQAKKSGPVGAASAGNAIAAA